MFFNPNLRLAVAVQEEGVEYKVYILLRSEPKRRSPQLVWLDIFCFHVVMVNSTTIILGMHGNFGVDISCNSDEVILSMYMSSLSVFTANH